VGYKRGRLLSGDELEEITRAMHRSITAVESMLLRSRQKDAAVKEGEENVDEMEDEEANEGEGGQGGELKHGLEDDSDEERDGMRPVAQPVGGILVAGYQINVSHCVEHRGYEAGVMVFISRTSMSVQQSNNKGYHDAQVFDP